VETSQQRSVFLSGPHLASFDEQDQLDFWPIARQYGITNREDLLSKMDQSVKLAIESATKSS
jgi:hypothetical protein